MRIDVCPQCHTEIKDLQNADIVEGKIELGDLYLCGACASISEFTRDGYRLLTKKQFNKLDPDELKDIRFAVRNIIEKAVEKINDQQARILGLDGKPIKLN